MTAIRRIIVFYDTINLFTSELIAGEDFSMLSKGLPDLAQAFETSLLVSY
jgi:hypothetical protein